MNPLSRRAKALLQRPKQELIFHSTIDQNPFPNFEKKTSATVNRHRDSPNKITPLKATHLPPNPTVTPPRAPSPTTDNLNSPSTDPNKKKAAAAATVKAAAPGPSSAILPERRSRSGSVPPRERSGQQGASSSQRGSGSRASAGFR